MDSQSYKREGRGDRYRERSRSNEPPVRRRSAYSPDRPYRARPGTDRDSRPGFHAGRRDGQRYSRFYSRRSSPPRHRRGRGSGSEEENVPRRRNRDYRDSVGDFRTRSNETNRHGSSEVGDDNSRIPPGPYTSIDEGDGQVHSYTNGPSTHPYTQPSHYPLPTAEQNHIPLPHQGMTNHFPPPGPLPPHYYHHQQNMASRMGYAPGAPPPSEAPVEAEPHEDVVHKILENLKAKGIVDKFRKTFLEEFDQKPDFVRLSDRVRGTVKSYLATRTWFPELNRNTERNLVRRRVLESSYFARELEDMLDKCFTEAESYFMPAIEDCVFSYLGIEKTKKEEVEGQDEEEEEEKVEEGQADDEESEEEEQESQSSQRSSMDVDSTEDESEAEEVRLPPLPREMPLPPPPPQLSGLGLGSFYPSLIPGQLAPSFLPPRSIAHLVPNHPPPPPLPLPMGLQDRHMPILSNTIIRRNVVEPPPLPPTDDDDDEPPPPPSDESDTDNSDSESEELSVGDRSPVMAGGQTPESDSEEESPPPLPPGDEDNESENPASPSPVKVPYQPPKEIPLSPLPPPPPAEVVEQTEQFQHKPKEILSRRASLESQESPQPPPPGEEDVELPLSYLLTGLGVNPEKSEIPNGMEREGDLDISVPAQITPLPATEEQKIPLPTDMEDGEIPLPDETGKASQEVRALGVPEIPLPVETMEVGIDEEIPLPDEEIPLPPSEDEESTPSHSEIPLPPLSIDISLPHSDDIPLTSLGDDLSPVTPGELDISDDSLSDIPLPPTPPTPPPTNQMQLSQVPSPPSPLPLEIDLPSPRPSEEEAEVSSTMEIEEDSCPPVRSRSPWDDSIQMPPPPPPPPMLPNNPINLNLTAEEVSVGFPPEEPQAALDAFEDEEDLELESPAFETFGETSPPRIDKVEEESFENLIHNVSPQKLFPRVPPPPPLGTDDKRDNSGEIKVKDSERKSSSSRGSGSSSSKSHRKSESSHRKHSSSSSSSHSKSKDKEGDSKSDSHHRHRSSHSHKRRHGDKEKSEDKSSRPSSSSSKDKNRGHGSSSGKKDKRDKEKHRSHSSRKDSGTPRPPVSSTAATNVVSPCEPLSGGGNLEEEKAVPVGSRLVDGELLEVVRWLDVIPSLEMKMRYYSKYTDPLLMDEDVSLDSLQ